MQYRAPANDHSFRSSPALVRAHAISGAAPSKTHLLWWVHTVHAPRIMRELIPCIGMSLVALLTLSHQSRKESSVGWGERDCRLTCDKKRNQNSLVKTQRIRKWSIVSAAWSHKGQRSGWGRPRRAKRSTVQHLLWATNHRKKRHLGGAFVFS